jgi:hypothetical protein
MPTLPSSSTTLDSPRFNAANSAGNAMARPAKSSSAESESQSTPVRTVSAKRPALR